MSIGLLNNSNVYGSLLVYPEQNNTLSTYTFKGEVDDNLIKIGGFANSTGYSGVVEGIKILPQNSHYITRVTPRFEVWPYEPVNDTVVNTYSTAFFGSSLIVGSENTSVGDASSTNLAIVGFNNTLSGDKMLVVGQGNTVRGSNVSSLLVGTTNTLTSPGAIINSGVFGQNHSISHSVTRSIYSGINNQTTGNATNVLVAGSGLSISGNNSSMFGANNEIKSASNALTGGFNNEIKNNSSSSNINYYGTVMFGWSNSSQNASSSTNNTKSSLIVGRNNQMRPTSKGAIESMIVGGYNNYAYAGADRGLIVGSNNVIIGDGS